MNYKNYAITLGKEGSRIRWSGENFDIPSYKTTALDTTGAGDMFAGGFFYGLIKTGSPEKAGHLGSLAASRIVAHFGARLDEDHKQLAEKII